MARNKTTNDSSRKSAPPRTSEAPKAKAAKPVVPSAEAIAARAYELYVESGYQDGYADEHWFQAERELRQMN